MRSLTFALVGLLGLVASSCAFLRGYSEGHSDAIDAYQTAPTPGFFRLVFDDFQGLNTDTMARSAAPWKLLGAAIVHVEHERDPSVPMTEAALSQILHRRFGFQTPRRIANWPAGVPQPPLRKPLGIVAGVVSRPVPSVEMEVYNTGCSTCHASNLFDEQGLPTDEAWIGLPSSSINLDAYAALAFEAFSWTSANPDAGLAAVKTVFPQVSDDELSSLRRFYLPRLKATLDGLAAKGRTSFIPYAQGGSGLTNGAATVRYYLGALDTSHFHPEQAGFVEAPELAGLRLRRGVLADGVYSPPGVPHYGPVEAVGSPAHRDGVAGVICLVTLGTLGVEPDKAVKNRARMREVIDFAFDTYVSPPFPGRVELPLAALGAEVFSAHCQSCHGKYEEHDGRMRMVSFPNVRAPMGTDRARLEAVTSEWLATLTATALGEVVDAQRSEEYVAPPLTGLWATAPYFHNGSVPTLWQLMHPTERPVRFEVGGHRLDYTRGGIAGEIDLEGIYSHPAGYQPWTEPFVYDTRELGRGNHGHEQSFEGLSEPEKRWLLEFLKRL